MYENSRLGYIDLDDHTDEYKALLLKQNVSKREKTMDPKAKRWMLSIKRWQVLWQYKERKRRSRFVTRCGGQNLRGTLDFGKLRWELMFPRDD